MNINYSGSITRALRKHLGHSQQEFCKDLDIGQGTLSKIEAGILELTAAQWVELCDKYKLDPMSLLTGKIEVLGKNNSFKKVTCEIGKFKIPQKYLIHQASTVRSFYPLLHFAILKLGPQTVYRIFESMGLDPDYFLIMGHPLSLAFIQDFYFRICELLPEKSLTASDILSEINIKDVHSFAILHIEDQKSRPYLQEESRTQGLEIHFFTDLINKLYENNAHYNYIGEDGVFMEITDQPHILELDLSSSFLEFRKDYTVATFQKLCHYFNVPFTLVSKITEKGIVLERTKNNSFLVSKQLHNKHILSQNL